MVGALKGVIVVVYQFDPSNQVDVPTNISIVGYWSGFSLLSTPSNVSTGHQLDHTLLRPNNPAPTLSPTSLIGKFRV